MKILLAVDDSKYSDAAVKGLIAQFPKAGNEVRVLNVIEPLPSIYGGAQWGYVADWQAVTREQRKQAESLVAQTAQTLQAAGFSTTTEIGEGDPKDIILDCANKLPADLIVMGPHGRKALERFLLGSVSERVARHAKCSVQIVRARNA